MVNQCSPKDRACHRLGKAQDNRCFPGNQSERRAADASGQGISGHGTTTYRETKGSVVGGDLVWIPEGDSGYNLRGLDLLSGTGPNPGRRRSYVHPTVSVARATVALLSSRRLLTASFRFITSTGEWA